MKWPAHPLNELCEFAVDCVNKTAPTVDYETPYKMIRTTNVKSGFIDLDDVRYVTEETFEKWTRRSKPRRGDVILTREAPVGEVGRFTSDDTTVMLGQRLFHYRPDPNKLDSNFLAYVLQSPQVQGRFKGMGFGATVDHVRVGDAERLAIPSPPLSIQRRIGSILSAYDDLIENNRRRIQLLERSARLLYKEWFVHLRFPGHEHVKIKDGVPEGWSRSSIREVCSAFEDGDWIESKDQGGDDFRLLQISNVGNNEFVETGNLRFISSETFRRLRCNEVVPGDILIARMPKPIGRAWYVTRQQWRMVTAVDVTIARPNPEVVDAFYYLHHLNSPAHIARCESQATGTTRLRISRSSLGALPILVPPLSVQRQFGDIASKISQQRFVLVRQSVALSRARDLLLPRLMSGELAV